MRRSRAMLVLVSGALVCCGGEVPVGGASHGAALGTSDDLPGTGWHRAGVLLTAAHTPGPPPGSIDDRALACTPRRSELRVGGQVAGEVLVTNDGAALAVHATCAAGWWLEELSLLAAPPGQTAPATPFVAESSPPATSATLQVALAAVPARCGETVRLAVGAQLIDSAQNEVSLWVLPTARGGGRDSAPMGLATFTICCAASQSGCTMGLPFWRQQSSWPLAEEQQLCGATWEALLAQKSTTDPWLALARQWIVTRLNIAAGATLPPAVTGVLAEASSLLPASCPPALSSDPQALDQLTTLLALFNDGTLGPGPCAVVPPAGSPR